MCIVRLYGMIKNKGLQGRQTRSYTTDRSLEGVFQVGRF